MRLNKLIIRLKRVYLLLRLTYRLRRIKPAGTISGKRYYAILKDKLEELGCEAPIFIPDGDMKVYSKEDVRKYLKLDVVSEMVYSKKHDCDDFAAKLFGKFAGLVWTFVHALNFFIDIDDIFWFIEPQTDKTSQKLDKWQGSKIRFFLGR